VILRDPVHGLITFEGRRERVISSLLETAEVQRLRRVRQLGLTSLVFPGAEHSRFSHALGAAHVMTRLDDRLSARAGDLPEPMRMTPDDSDDALAAALLHDVGHGPFSHLFEEVVPHARHHEQWTKDVLLDPSTEVHAALERLRPGMSRSVVGLLEGTSRLGYLSRSLSGTLDVDRCDYLLRDSHMTGARYGLYDLDWLLEALRFDRAPTGEFVLAVEGRKGLPPIEGFFLGRHFMYRQVYHHKATRAAECLIRGIFARMAELVREGREPNALPPALRAAVLSEPARLADYLALDDAVLTTCFSSWELGADPTLARLCSALRARRLPKTIPLPEDPAVRAEALARAEAVARNAGVPPEFSVWLDTTSDVPYGEPSDGSAGLWVSIRHQPIRRLGDVSFLLGELRNKRIEAARLVLHEDLRDDVLAAVSEILV
jgi:HD superfamily phosphohydrolase